MKKAANASMWTSVRKELTTVSEVSNAKTDQELSPVIVETASSSPLGRKNAKVKAE